MIKPKQVKTIKELYKCHFTGKEVALMMKLSYAVIANLYRGFKGGEITKYDRYDLSLEKEIRHDAKYYSEQGQSDQQDKEKFSLGSPY